MRKTEGIDERTRLVFVELANIAGNYYKLAEIIGIKSQLMYRIKNGKRSASLSVYHTIAKLYNVNLNYIFLNRGSMFINLGENDRRREFRPIAPQIELTNVE